MDVSKLGLAMYSVFLDDDLVPERSACEVCMVSSFCSNPFRGKMSHHEREFGLLMRTYTLDRDATVERLRSRPG
jgi:hypothetical protein